jgi:hypothetical protein
VLEDPARETVDSEGSDDATEKEDESSCWGEYFGDEGFRDCVDEEEAFDLGCVTGGKDAGIETTDTVRYEDPARGRLFSDVCFG